MYPEPVPVPASRKSVPDWVSQATAAVSAANAMIEDVSNRNSAGPEAGVQATAPHTSEQEAGTHTRGRNSSDHASAAQHNTSNAMTSSPSPHVDTATCSVPPNLGSSSPLAPPPATSRQHFPSTSLRTNVFPPTVRRGRTAPAAYSSLSHDFVLPPDLARDLEETRRQGRAAWTGHRPAAQRAGAWEARQYHGGLSSPSRRVGTVEHDTAWNSGMPYSSFGGARMSSPSHLKPWSRSTPMSVTPSSPGFRSPNKR